MGALDGGIAGIFAAAFGEIYQDGILRTVTLTDDGTGSLVETATDKPIKVQTDSCTEAMRQQAGYTDKDVRLLILAQGLTMPNTDARVIDGRGVEYRLYNVTTDPAQSYFECRAVKA